MSSRDQEVYDFVRKQVTLLREGGDLKGDSIPVHYVNHIVESYFLSHHVGISEAYSLVLKAINEMGYRVTD